MSSVDDRIVNMQFNNKQFETNAAQSSRTLQNLDRTIANAGKGKGLAQMGTAVEGVQAKFTALQVAGAAALGTIVSKATSAGLSMIKSFTLDPITQGFSEYTTNLNSIQTVMANTGKGVGEVNKYMNQLNKYSDQTIYNFSEMARNIGTFTAAGVDLKTATSSIQGIANLAALSGSNSQQASTAMYQLSQAIAAGKVGLQDWNSVVNAGMGGKVFQTALATTAQAMGTVSANAIATEGPMKRLTINGESFRQSISAVGGSQSWLTSDVLTTTLSILDGRLAKASYRAQGFSEEIIKQKIEMQQAKLAAQGYSEEQIKSMTKTANAAYKAATTIKSLPQFMEVIKESIGSIWSNSFMLILGNFTQSKKMWSNIGDQVTGPNGILTKMGNKWTATLREWAGNGGRWKMFSALKRIAEQVGVVFTAIGKAWRDVFPPSSTNVLFEISRAFNHFSKNLIIGKGAAGDLRDIFGGVFAILHIGWTIVKTIASAFFSLFNTIFDGSGQARGGILSFVAGIANGVKAFDKWLSSGAKIEDLFKGLVKVVKNFVGALDFSGGFGKFADSFDAISGIDISGPLEGVGRAVDFVKARFDEFMNSGSKVAEVLKSIGNVGGAAGDIISNAAGIGGNIIAGIVEGITGSSVGAIKGAVEQIGHDIVEWFKSVLGIHSPAAELVPVGTNIMLGIAEGIISAIGAVLQSIGKVGKFVVETFKALFEGISPSDVAGAIESFIGGIGDLLKGLLGGGDALGFASFMNALFSGALILTIRQFLKNMGGLSGVGNSIRETFNQLTDTLKTMQGAIKAKMILNIALAVAALTASMYVLSTLDAEALGKSLGSMAIMMALLVTTLSQMDKIGKTTGADGEVINTFNANLVMLAASMLIIATAMVTMAAAVAILGNMDPETLAKGLGAIALMMGIMIVSFQKFAAIEGSISGMAGAILLISFALNVLAAAVLAFGNMQLDTLGKGFGSIAVGLGIMVIALQKMSMVKNVGESAKAIFILSAAMLVLSVAVLAFGNMSLETLAQGFIAIGVALALFVVALNALAVNPKGVLAAAASMVLMATALNMLVPVILALGTAPWQDVAAGIGFVALALGVLLVAAAAAMVVAPGLYALGITIGLIGAAMFLAGAGMLAFATGLAILVAVGVAGVAIMVVAFHAFMALLPTLAVQVAAAFVTFIQTIAAASPKIRAAMSEIFKNMLGVVTDAIPEIRKLLQALIDAGISIVKTSVPKWIDAAFTIIDAFLDAAADHAPNISKSIAILIATFIDGIDQNLQVIIKQGTELIVNFITGIGKAANKIVRAAAQTILDFLHGLDQAIVDYSGEFRKVGISIAGHLIDGLTGGLAGKISGALTSAWNAAKNNLPGPLKGVFRTSARGPTIADQVAAAMANVNTTLATNTKTGAVNQSVLGAANAASAEQARADNAAQVARIADRNAQMLADKAAKKGAGKGVKAKAKKAANQAAKTQNKADQAQARSDSAAAALQFQQNFASADTAGKADLFKDRAAELAAAANDALSRSQAEEAQAAKYKKTNKKLYDQILAQAKKDAESARQLAQQANDANAEAIKYYGQARTEANAEVNNRIAGLEASIEADRVAREEAAKYDAADDAGKVKILTARAEANEAKADAAKKAAADYIAKAKAAVALNDTEEANRLLDLADTQAQLAVSSQDQAEQERESIKQLLETVNQDTGGGTTGGPLTPSKAVLEDAAAAIDRYTASLAQAEELAGAERAPVQFVQNNYSPDALSASEIYRQSNNLISAYEIKMGADS